MKTWNFMEFIRVGTITGALLLVACSSVVNPASITPTARPTLSVSSTSSPMLVPATATAFPLNLSYEEAVHLYDYDSTVPVDIQEKSVTDHQSIPVHDITYAAYDPQFSGLINGRISAYLVTPPGIGPFAGVIFMHWLGNPNGNRDEFLNEAVALAQQGAVSLLVEGVFPWWQSPSSYEKDRVQVVHQVVELRRALDVLLSQAGVDPQRIGFVGHDYGAMFGSVLTGVDQRIKTYVLMAGMGNFSDWSLKYWPGTGSMGVDAYRQAMAIVDPIFYIRHAGTATVLFQFAQTDQYISAEAALQFYKAGTDPKQLLWYNTSHSLNTEADRSDRDTWLSSQLGLSVTRTPAGSPTSTPGVASTRMRPVDGMAEVFVPEGNFNMGSYEGESDEQPIHSVYLDAYWIDQTEVTNTMFARFVENTGYQTDAEGKGKSLILIGATWSEVAGADWTGQSSCSAYILE